MSAQRGLVQPALITSTIVLVLCFMCWGALGAISFAGADMMSTTAHRYVSVLLVTTTVCAVMINLLARVVRALRLADDGYAAGYADGLDARPVTPNVTRLVPSRR